jgi:tetratricopeptide (TPR) repeat protein
MPATFGDFRPRRPILGWRAQACALGLGALLALGGTALAQDSGETGLKNGSASYTAGKYDIAVRQLTAAINSGTLAANDAARAFYLRGMAYRKLDQPSHAIADLGAAVWLGLPAPDRASAQVNRALSYRAAGLGAEADAELASARKTGGSQVDTLLAENGGATDASVAAFSTELHVEKEPPPPSPPPTRTAEASAQWTTSGDTPAPPSAPQKPPAPDAASWETTVATPEEPASGGNRLSRWWGSVRGSGSSGDQPAAPPSESSTPAPTADWTTQTRDGDAGPPPQTRTALATPAPAPAPTATGGGYRLQLTATRSEEEAKQLWQQVLGQHKELAGREPLIEKTDIGNLGTFYRLQVGPFPDKAESLKLCEALKQGGVDCFVVAR